MGLLIRCTCNERLKGVLCGVLGSDLTGHQLTRFEFPSLMCLNKRSKMPVLKHVLARTIAKAAPCEVRGCPKPRYHAYRHCQHHHDSIVKKGTEHGSALTSRQRLPYIFSALAILKQRLLGRGRPLGHRCPDAHSVVNDLHVLLKCRIQPASLHDFAKVKPLKKAHSILGAIFKRYPIEQDAAKVIIATVLGTLLCLKLEPGVERGETYQSFQILRALSSIIRPEIIQSGRLILKRARPRPTGRYVTGHLHHLVVTPILYFMREAGPALEQEILQHMLRYPSKKQRAIRIPQPKKERT